MIDWTAPRTFSSTTSPHDLPLQVPGLREFSQVGLLWSIQTCCRTNGTKSRHGVVGTGGPCAIYIQRACCTDDSTPLVCSASCGRATRLRSRSCAALPLASSCRRISSWRSVPRGNFRVSDGCRLARLWLLALFPTSPFTGSLGHSMLQLHQKPACCHSLVLLWS